MLSLANIICTPAPHQSVVIITPLLLVGGIEIFGVCCAAVTTATFSEFLLKYKMLLCCWFSLPQRNARVCVWSIGGRSGCA